tara:strand:- start:233 stop:1768 length:1536 start_codon:yes stop_codon:yes gene_type:complete
MSVVVSYKKQTLLGITGLIILFSVIELGANVWWISQVNCEFEGNEIFVGMNDEQKRQLCVDLYDIKVSGMELIPNQDNESISINNLGFRGDDFIPEKPDSVYRIFMLGGSTMFGHGATSDYTTIPGYAQEFFKEEFKENDIEIINAGIQGANSFDEVSLIEGKLLDYSPDMIVIYDGWNDLRERHSSDVIHGNWETVCNLGKQNSFKTIISLQPISGFGNKSLTEQELENVVIGTDYFDNKLLESLDKYEKYAMNLESLEQCDKTLDLRNVFDNESSPIYWDQGHVSDRGNYLVAQELKKGILEELPTSLPKSEQMDVSEDIEMFEAGNQVQYLFSMYKTPIMINSIFSFNVSNQDKIEKSNDVVYKTQNKDYDGEVISVIIEVERNENMPNQKNVKIFTVSDTSNSNISNVTYFLKILKNDKMIFSDYFYVQDEVLALDVFTNEETKTEVSGNRQYDHNAIIAEKDMPIQISGPILHNNEIYEFNIELRTIHDQNNWVFGLENFSVKVIP